jgi:hypothetical protein
VDTLPAGAGWAYEPKFDGFRALAWREPGRVYLQSRSGRALGGYFPDITRAVAAVQVMLDPDRYPLPTPNVGAPAAQLFPWTALHQAIRDIRSSLQPPATR